MIPTQPATRNPNLRVLHVYRTYFPDTQGGLEETIRQICITTANLGVESRVLSLSQNPKPSVVERPESKVYRAKQTAEIASCGISFEALFLFREQAKWADIIHYHFPWPFADVLNELLEERRPRLITYHSDIVRQRRLGMLYRPLMHRFLSCADAIVCTSPNYFATSDVLSRYQHKTHIIPIGIHESSYPTASRNIQQLTEEKYGTEFFLFVGVLRYYKGLHILLDAIQDAPYRVVIAGSGPTELELKRQAAQLNLTNVVFAGSVPDSEKVALFRACKAVVFPSYLRTEAFGVTLLEGAMFSKPLISAEVGSGTSHVNIDDETGIVVPPGSATEMRTAMERLFHDDLLAQRLGRNARARFEKHFTGALMGKRYAELYHQLLGQTKPPSLYSEKPASHRAGKQALSN